MVNKLKTLHIEAVIFIQFQLKKTTNKIKYNTVLKERNKHQPLNKEKL